MRVPMRLMLLVSLFLIFVAGPAQAALIGVTLEDPKILYDSGGTTTYDEDSDEFVVKAEPQWLRDDGSLSPIVPGTFDISIEVDSTGSLVGGGPGAHDLSITGAVLGLSGVLLTGDILYFGFEETGETDTFDFLFVATGGKFLEPEVALFSLGQQVGVLLTSEKSDFTGDFTVDFRGGAKGTAGAVIPEPSGFIVFAIGAMVAGGAAVTRRRAA
jgi:hypothetical protein